MPTEAAPSSGTPAEPPRQRSRLAPALITLVAVLLGFLSAFLAWFVFSGTSVALLPDTYHSMITYITQGSGGLQSSNVLGAALVASSTSDPVLLLAFAMILFFWPAMLLSGLYNAVARSFAAYPFVWGLITFIFAYVLVWKASATLGIGAWLALAAAVLFLVASILGRWVQPQPAPVAQSAGSTTQGSPPAASGSPPASP